MWKVRWYKHVLDAKGQVGQIVGTSYSSTFVELKDPASIKEVHDSIAIL